MSKQRKCGQCGQIHDKEEMVLTQGTLKCVECNNKNEKISEMVLLIIISAIVSYFVVWCVGWFIEKKKKKNNG